MSDDLNSRYGLNPAHSEVVEACQVVAPCDALDMGCSNGRNALYMSQPGFHVTAVDDNPRAIAALPSIITQGGNKNIRTPGYELTEANRYEGRSAGKKGIHQYSL